MMAKVVRNKGLEKRHCNGQEGEVYSGGAWFPEGVKSKSQS